MEFFLEIIRRPGLFDSLILVVIVGVLLWSVNNGMRPPWNERVREIGMVITGTGVSIILLGIALGMEIRSNWLEVSPSLAIHSPGGESPQDNQGPGLSWKNFTEGTWYEVASWRGTESKITEIFQISSRIWMISWHTRTIGNKKPGKLAIAVHSSDGKSVGVVTNIEGTDENKVILQGSGNYYLIISATQPFKILVKARSRY